MARRKANSAPSPTTLLTSRPPDRLEEEDAEEFLNSCSELTFNRDEAAEWLQAIPQALDALEQSLIGRSKEQVLAERQRVFESRLRDWQQNPGLDGKPRSPEPQPPVEAEVEAEPGIPFAPDLKMELSEYITAIRTLHEAAEQAFDNLVAEIASFEAAIEELKA